jgi:hypothetical protein
MKTYVVAAVLLSATLHPCFAEEALFSFTTHGSSNEEFVFKLDDPQRIAEARAILAGSEQEKVHVMGRIVKRPAPHNPRWQFHLDPSSIQFFALAIEVCDAQTSYVEDHLDEAGGAFLPGLWWCPWSSRLVQEIK